MSYQLRDLSCNPSVTPEIKLMYSELNGVYREGAGVTLN
jgi:hypothetical protein